MVLDSSSGVSSSLFNNEWAQEKEFVKNFVAASELGQNENVQVAVVNFGSTANIAAPCGSLSTVEQFSSFVHNLPKINGRRAINQALLQTREAYLGCERLNVKPVVIFLTNGQESDELGFDTRKNTEEMLKSEALLFIGAVGPYINTSDIKRMSRYVIDNVESFSYITVNSFNDLQLRPENIALLSKICLGKLTYFA